MSWPNWIASSIKSQKADKLTMSNTRAWRLSSSLRALIVIALGAVAGLGALALWLGSRWGAPLATACQEACNRIAVPLGWLQVTPLGVGALFAGLGAVSLSLAGSTIVKQTALSRRLDQEIAKSRRRWPAKLRSAYRQLRLIETAVCLDDREVYAFCHGYLRPVVYVSHGLVEELSPDELRAVLAHEAEHARRRDPLRLLLGMALSRALFFLPVADEMRERAAVAAELTADNRAVREAGVPPLASALRKMILGETRQPAHSPAVGGLDAVAERVRYLATGSTGSLAGISARRVAASVAIALAIFAVSLGAGAAPTFAAAQQPSCCLIGSQTANNLPCSTTSGGVPPVTQRPAQPSAKPLDCILKH
jgi:Zn-dependent protease with chaperone function